MTNKKDRTKSDQTGNTTLHFFEKTWKTYLKSKYKEALDRWNKETGGGDGTAPSFIKYCGGDKWLAPIYCKDLETNFLLASNAGGRMPAHMQCEGGFDINDPSSLTTPSNFKRVSATETMADFLVAKREHTRTVSRFTNEVSKMASHLQTLVDARKTDSSDEAIKEIGELSKALKDDALMNTFSPESRREYEAAL